MAASPLSFVAEGLRLSACRGQAKALLLAAAMAVATGAPAATPPNTTITNSATATFSVSGVTITAGGTASVTTTASTPATLRLLSYAGAATGTAAGVASLQNVPVTQCSQNGNFVPLAAPVVPGAGTLAVPNAYPLAPATVYASGDLVFIEVTDYDQNLNPNVADTITVTVRTAAGDAETLRLTETGPSTGVFLGYIRTSKSAVQPGNCVLNTAASERITASYVDASEASVAVSAVALVDPIGIVFDSSTGLPVDGAKVTLVDTATGQPAKVLGNDGVSSYPSTVISGSTVSDSGGASYAFPAGGYQFPRVLPGTYRLQIQTPPGYKFPSTVDTVVLKGLTNGARILSQGSHGEPFVLVPGPALELDLPVDPGALGEVSIVKSADKTVAAIGDFVPYTLAISNRNNYPLPGLQVADRLPPGFRYQKGSARLNDAPIADPTIAGDGRGLQFALGTLAGGGSATLRYVAAISPGAAAGPAENTAQAVGRIVSNTAKAVVVVREDLNRTRAMLVGRVTLAQSCERNPKEQGAVRGLKDVRVLLEDGTFVATDAEGNWHADNLRAGTHVVQIDTTTLPPGMALRNCDAGNRTAGRDFSQFVNVQGGSLWRADFRLVRTPTCVRQDLERQQRHVELRLAGEVATESVTATVLLPAGAHADAKHLTIDGQSFGGAQVEQGFVVVRLGAQPAHWRHVLGLDLDGPADGELKAAVRVQPPGQGAVELKPLALAAGAPQASQCAPVPFADGPAATPAPRADDKPADAADTAGLIEKLPYDDKWLAAAPPGNEWLHPRVGFTPALPIVKVAVKHARGTEALLKVNGVAVDALRFEGTVLSPDGKWMLSNWRSVDLADGANVLDLSIVDAQKQVVLHEQRTIYYSIAPAQADFDAAHSKLVADGRSNPVIAVRMLDRLGKPVRKGLGGEFTIDPPYVAQQLADAQRNDPLAGSPGGKPRFQIGEDGVALIPLQATTRSGEAVLHFDFGNNRVQDVRAWLNADLREWVLVGFAEGSLGHRKLAGNMEALQASGVADQLFDQDRLAFYAKGRVRGDYLLTAAYDSAKEQGTGARTALRQAIDPAQYYTLYGDATQAQADAASTGKLYLKIEKKQFYALFGDFDTGLTVTELGRYSRTLTGAKSEYKGERFGYNAFAARTSQSFLKDELQGDGTSGLYHLRTRNILVNSEKLRIEVRDRFQPDRVLSTRSLTQYIDYSIDYALGTVMFHDAVAAHDDSLNPVFIVAEYESDDQAGATWTYGGRAAMKVGEKSEVGVTRIHESNTGREATLTAADATVRIGDADKVRAEIATSDRNSASGPQAGKAYLVEAAHDDGKLAARAYASGQQPNFGLGQQVAAAQGLRKAGAEARLKISDDLQVQGDAYRQQDLTTGARRQVAEAQAQWANKEAGVTLNGGARSVDETDAFGASTHVNQVTAGAAVETLEHKLVLRTSTDLDVGSQGTVNYPNRFVLGADYRVTPDTTVFATHEIARGEALKADTTRVGLRSRLWTGAEAQFGAGQQDSLDANRLYATMGLVQRIKLDDHWSADAGIDRVQTFRSSANPLGTARPLASGTTGSSTAGVLTEDYTAIGLGLNYRDDVWSANARTEWRRSAGDTKLNWILGAQRRLDQGRVVAAGLTMTRERSASDVHNVDARLSYAFRPNDSDLIWLDRLEYVEQGSNSSGSRLLTRKLINNFNANWRAERGTQIAFQYSAKYSRELLVDSGYTGFTDLVGIEMRHDIAQDWDIGLHASMLHAWNGSGRSYALGLSVGYRMATNTWVSAGYNVLGFKDPDFSGAEYRARGFYVNMRVKFDQDTFDLNDRAKGQLPLKP